MYIIIIGCGRIGAYLARLLQDEHNVVVIDKYDKPLGRLGENFNGLTMRGDGMDLDVLKEAGIEKSDALAVTTSNDNTNIIIAQIAKRVFNLSKVVARVSDAGKSEIYRNFEVDTVNSTSLFSSLIRDKIIERRFSTQILESNKLTLLEIKADQNYLGKKVKELNIPGEFQIIAILRGDEPIIPEEALVIESDDIIVGIVRIASLKRLRKTLRL
jgi:trk system potassium uptake protein